MKTAWAHDVPYIAQNLSAFEPILAIEFSPQQITWGADVSHEEKRVF